MAEPESDKFEALSDKLRASNKLFPVLIVFLSAVVALGLYALTVQLSEGLVVTGLRNKVVWGPYIINTVFFLAVGMAGTLISAILRLTGAEWRRPITRMAEAVTVFAVMVGMLNVVIDMGRPERILNMFVFGRIESPLVWDFLAIGSYLIGSIIFLYIGLIPDIAAISSKLSGSSVKRRLFRILSAGWIGDEAQRKKLGRAMGVMAVVIVPVAVSVHSVLSWVFGITYRPGWHSTIFGPYFVVGAVFSGTATVILIMAFFRRYYHLEEYITASHFRKLGKLLLGLGLTYLYFMISEYTVEYYGGDPLSVALLNNIFWGDFRVVYWTFLLGGLLGPILIMALPKTRTVKGIIIAALLVNIGMWLKRYIMIVPSLAQPLVLYDWAQYQPTWVELSITAGSAAGFVLLVLLFSRLFPIVSIWELREGDEGSIAAGHLAGPILVSSQSSRAQGGVPEELGEAT